MNLLLVNPLNIPSKILLGYFRDEEVQHFSVPFNIFTCVPGWRDLLPCLSALDTYHPLCTKRAWLVGQQTDPCTGAAEKESVEAKRPAGRHAILGSH